MVEKQEILTQEGYNKIEEEVEYLKTVKRKEIAEKILKNVPEQNKKYVQNQLDILDKNFMDYLCYWNEKYYRNGFVDGVQLIGGCFEE